MLKAGGCQSIETASGAASCCRINLLPSTHEPSGGFKAKQNWIKRPGSETTAFYYIGTRQLVGWSVKKYLQDAQSLEGHSYIAVLRSHARKSTEGAEPLQVFGEGDGVYESGR